MGETTLGIQNMSVVGEAAYQRALNRARRHSKTNPLRVRLVAEQNNSHDANAVRVDMILGWSKPTVGYLSRANAKKWHPIIHKTRGPVILPAKLLGGTKDRPTLGIAIGEDFA